jgi:hypothetical protein
MTPLFVLLVVAAVLGSIGYGGVALVRWTHRTGRRSWLWFLGAYVTANILWAICRPFVAQP